jgi:micrococcal nuclease
VEVYEYRATLNRVYDADSIFLNINPGPGMWSREEAFRLLDIDAWEIRGEERPLGLKARDWLKDTLENANEIFIRSYKDKAGKYGRWLAWVFADGVDINKKLVKLGHAMAVKY